MAAFQEDLLDVIVISCVRTEYPGFLSDLRRANVAVTRGTRLRVVVGDETLLSTVKLWKAILADEETMSMLVSSPMLW